MLLSEAAAALSPEEQECGVLGAYRWVTPLPLASQGSLVPTVPVELPGTLSRDPVHREKSPEQSSPCQ